MTLIKMEEIFHEKQEGLLCAQHCLNALLQGSYFTPVDLAILAQQMDNEERMRMAESGIDSEDYKHFLQQPSGNYDDSGYFSVQVISSALKVWGLELIPYTSTEPAARQAQECPGEMQAFICNYRDHWFTIRRLGHQWFNLNSLLTGPELISDTYLAMFLAQLQKEGYSIFIVCGSLPESVADELLMEAPAVQTEKPKLINVGQISEIKNVVEEDADLQRALRLSLNEDYRKADSSLPQTSSSLDKTSNKYIPMPVHKEQLKEALRLSMGKDFQESSSNQSSSFYLSDEQELEAAVKLSLQSDHEINQSQNSQLKVDVPVNEADPELEKAVKMSLECCDIKSGIEVEEVRRQRLRYLEGNRPGRSTEILSNNSELNT